MRLRLVEAVPADGERAGLLEVPPGSALLETRRVAHQVDGRPVGYAHDFFRADRTRVHLRELGTNWKRTVRRSRGDSTRR
ncbi:UTRA domain-containing protein [Kineococcus sp. NBC_00420]|uniref:UTRA domain-containing protein n=1 Tax=Kineococcus sp. NBC_00420 TaxID=2903564 RepID=UPI002E221813